MKEAIQKRSGGNLGTTRNRRHMDPITSLLKSWDIGFKKKMRSKEVLITPGIGTGK